MLFAVGSNVGAVLLSLSPLGVHELQPIESGPAMLELALHLGSEYLVGAAEGLPATAVIRRLRTGHRAFACPAHGGRNQATGCSAQAAEPTETMLPAEDAMAAFTAALS